MTTLIDSAVLYVQAKFTPARRFLLCTDYVQSILYCILHLCALNTCGLTIREQVFRNCRLSILWIENFTQMPGTLFVNASVNSQHPQKLYVQIYMQLYASEIHIIVGPTTTVAPSGISLCIGNICTVVSFFTFQLFEFLIANIQFLSIYFLNLDLFSFIVCCVCVVVLFVLPMVLESEIKIYMILFARQHKAVKPCYSSDKSTSLLNPHYQALVVYYDDRLTLAHAARVR